MTVALDLTTARARAESLMTSTCTVRAKGSGDPVTDPTTGAVTYPAGNTWYSGPCRVRPAGHEARVGEAGAAEVFAFDYVISVPFSATTIMEGGLVTVDSSPDAALVNVVVEIQKVDRGENITARRLYCEDVA